MQLRLMLRLSQEACSCIEERLDTLSLLFVGPVRVDFSCVFGPNQVTQVWFKLKLVTNVIVKNLYGILY